MNKLKNPTYPSGTNLFKGKGVILTAAAGAGIGFASAKRFLEEGADIVISDVHETRLADATKNLLDLDLGKVSSILCDVTDDKAIDDLFSFAESKLDSVDAVINNAGLGGECELINMTNDEWSKVIDITLNGAMKIMRAAIPALESSQGCIVNNASVLGWRAQAGQSHYAAAKAGVMALTRCVALETIEKGIRINAVAPSLAINPHLAKTSSNELIDHLASQEAYGRGAEPWEIANVILFLASDLASYLTGEVISVSSQRA